MQGLIDIFASNDDAWALDKELRSEYAQVAEEHGYVFGSSKTKREVEKFLVDEIIEQITGVDISSAELNGVINHFHLKNAVSSRQEGAHALFFLRAIRACTQAQPYYTTSEKGWAKAKTLLQAYHSLSNTPPDHILLNDSIDLISTSIIH